MVGYGVETGQEGGVFLTFDCLTVNCWDLSEMLENFLILWIGDALYPNRLGLCGRETANGVELWRRLIADSPGGRVSMKITGVKP